jgi:hypothetical protein
MRLLRTARTKRVAKLWTDSASNLNVRRLRLSVDFKKIQLERLAPGSLEQLRGTSEYLEVMKQPVDAAIKSARRRERYNLL